MVALLSLAELSQSFPIAMCAERCMDWGCDLIGDTIKPARGWRVFQWCADHIDIVKIRRIKVRQVHIYEQMLLQLVKDFGFIPPYVQSDRGELRGWPIIFERGFAELFIQRVRRAGLLLRAELADSVWSKNYTIIYLPLGPQVEDVKIYTIIHTVQQALLGIDAKVIYENMAAA